MYIYIYIIYIYIYIFIYIYIYIYKYIQGKNKTNLFPVVPLSIHYYQQVIFLLCHILKRIYKS